MLPVRPWDSCRWPLSLVLLLRRPSVPPVVVAVAGNATKSTQVSKGKEREVGGGSWRGTTYLRVGAVRSKLIKDKRIQEVHMTSHLLHASYLSLLLRVCVFDNQAGGCTL